MAHLGATDLHAVLRLTLEARSAEDLTTFRNDVVSGLRSLVACDSVGYNELDLEHGTAFAITDSPVFDGIEERFVELAAQHPLVARQNAGDLRTYMLSDFLSERRLHRLELYHDIYRPLGVEDQLVFGLPGEVIVGVAFNRARRTFTERDRDVLELLRPHLAESYVRVLERERARALIDALDGSLEQRNVAAILLDRWDRVAHASGAARGMLAAYFEAGAADTAALPPALAGLGHDVGPRELTVAGPRGRLRVRAQEDGAAAGWRVLLLEERRTCPPGVESLRELGLTNREAQVLRLLACGKRSRQIADELQISTATVSKHLEHIYARLGVSSRAEAIARAYA